MEELTEAELRQLIDGFYSAERGADYEPQETRAWRDGFALYFVFRAENTERAECQTVH